MPIYLGTTEITGLYLGEQNLSTAYRNEDEVYIEQVTLTLEFTDSTPDGAQLNSVSSVELTGTPGTTFDSFTRTITRLDNYTLSSPTVTETNDTGDDITSTFTGGGNDDYTITISGTFPDVSKTITLDYNVTAANKIDRSLMITRTVTPSGISGNSSRTARFTVTWAGGGTATFTANQGFGSSEGGAIAHLDNNNSNVSSKTINSGDNVFVIWQNAIAVQVQASGRVTVNVPETDTYESATGSLGATGASQFP